MLPISMEILWIVLVGVHTIRILTAGITVTKYVVTKKADMMRDIIGVSLISAF